MKGRKFSSLPLNEAPDLLRPVRFVYPRSDVSLALNVAHLKRVWRSKSSQPHQFVAGTLQFAKSKLLDERCNRGPDLVGAVLLQ